jgi:hypothetical protein
MRPVRDPSPAGTLKLAQFGITRDPLDDPEGHQTTEQRDSWTEECD